MLLEFKDVINSRRSIRKYKGTPVPRESVLKVLEAARLAPSAMHRQP
jgi:nitroreductase